MASERRSGGYFVRVVEGKRTMALFIKADGEALKKKGGERVRFLAEHAGQGPEPLHSTDQEIS